MAVSGSGKMADNDTIKNQDSKPKQKLCAFSFQKSFVLLVSKPTRHYHHMPFPYYFIFVPLLVEPKGSAFCFIFSLFGKQEPKTRKDFGTSGIPKKRNLETNSIPNISVFFGMGLPKFGIVSVWDFSVWVWDFFGLVWDFREFFPALHIYYTCSSCMLAPVQYSPEPGLGFTCMCTSHRTLTLDPLQVPVLSYMLHQVTVTCM